MSVRASPSGAGAGATLRGAWGAVLGVCLGLSSACRSTEARALEAEVQSLSRSIDALRDAPNPEKSALLTQLEQHPVQSESGRQLKQLCLEAYRKHVAALAATERAKQLLAAREGGPSAALEAAKEITLSESELAQASGLTERCVSRQGELRRASR